MDVVGKQLVFGGSIEKKNQYKSLIYKVSDAFRSKFRSCGLGILKPPLVILSKIDVCRVLPKIRRLIRFFV
jgi:hypothetical protein